MDNVNLTVGSTAPEFRLPASDGNEIALTDYLPQQNVYLFFVREFN
jgi:peroxiredoxin